jgi:electron transport complex protein RnfG
MASKKESTFTNMVVVLFVISIVAATSLGFVYEFTKTPIENAKIKKQELAIAQVVPAFDNKPMQEAEIVKIGDSELIFFPAKKGGKLVGVAVKTFSESGFSGRVDIMVGFKPDGTIVNTSVLGHKETPGLGDKMSQSKSKWSTQFNDKDPKVFKLTVKKDGGDVDAITASTISSRAFSEAIDLAYKEFMKKYNN